MRVREGLQGEGGGDQEAGESARASRPRKDQEHAVFDLNLRILNAVDRITCHRRKETIYSGKKLDLGGV